MQARAFQKAPQGVTTRTKEDDRVGLHRWPDVPLIISCAHVDEARSGACCAIRTLDRRGLAETPAENVNASQAESHHAPGVPCGRFCEQRGQQRPPCTQRALGATEVSSSNNHNFNGWDRRRFVQLGVTGDGLPMTVPHPVQARSAQLTYVATTLH